MDVDPIPLAILLAALLTVGFAIASETSMTTVSRSDVRKLGEDGDGRAKSVDRLLRDPCATAADAVVAQDGWCIGGGRRHGAFAAGYLVALILGECGRGFLGNLGLAPGDGAQLGTDAQFADRLDPCSLHAWRCLADVACCHFGAPSWATSEQPGGLFQCGYRAFCPKMACAV